MAAIQEFFGRILPVFENKWTRKKFGAFVNRLPTELQQDYAELHAFLSTLPDKGKEYRRIEFYEADDEKGITAYEFLVLLFNLRPKKVDLRDDETAGHIRAILDNAEEHLLHHVISCRECGTYKLCMSNIRSSRKNLAGKPVLFKNRALFTVREFMTELDAAGVPGVSGFLCLGRLFQGQPNEAALCSVPRMGDLYRVKVPKAGCGHQASSRRQGCPS